jgi:hypothetical protein
MTELAFIIAIVIAFYTGYKYNQLKKMLSNLQESIKEKTDAQKPESQDKSIFLDPLDIATQARMEHEAMLRRLNPDE